jgi:hypothetical protein
MKRDLQEFIHERGENLAIVYLTRRSDLLIERITANQGIDLLVTIPQPQLPIGRMFGVQVKALNQAFDHAQANLILPQNAQPTNLHDLPFPVCVFLFSMTDDRGYYCWLKLDPTQSTLNMAGWAELEVHSIEPIINQVNAWYDARVHSVA